MTAAGRAALNGETEQGSGGTEAGGAGLSLVLRHLSKLMDHVFLALGF